MARGFAEDLPTAQWRRPTRMGAMVFALKVQVLRLRRGLADLIAGRPRRHAPMAAYLPLLLAQSRTPLYGDARTAERLYQDGKVANLRTAAKALDGLVIPAGETFSFWRQVGRPSRRRGFVTGRMLQQGCLVPSVGGGLCQLSNALYQAARLAGCDIVERHAHSKVVPGSAAEAGRDATVAWNYVDLRVRPAQSLRLEVKLEADDLLVQFFGAAGAARSEPPADIAPLAPDEARTCATCDETACFRREKLDA